MTDDERRMIAEQSVAHMSEQWGGIDLGARLALLRNAAAAALAATGAPQNAVALLSIVLDAAAQRMGSGEVFDTTVVTGALAVADRVDLVEATAPSQARH